MSHCGKCETTSVAARHGHRDCLEFCVSRGYPWSPDTTRAAAENGRRDCLEFCVSRGCPWHPATTYGAAVNGHRDCLEYIFENCKDIVTWEDSGLEENVDKYSSEIQNYVRSIKEEWQWYSERDQNIKG